MNRWHTWSQLCGTLFVVHSVLRSSPHRLEVLLLQLLCGRPADDVALRVGGAEVDPCPHPRIDDFLDGLRNRSKLLVELDNVLNVLNETLSVPKKSFRVSTTHR